MRGAMHLPLLVISFLLEPQSHGPVLGIPLFALRAAGGAIALALVLSVRDVSGFLCLVVFAVALYCVRCIVRRLCYEPKKDSPLPPIKVPGSPAMPSTPQPDRFEAQQAWLQELELEEPDLNYNRQIEMRQQLEIGQTLGNEIDGLPEDPLSEPSESEDEVLPEGSALSSKEFPLEQPLREPDADEPPMTLQLQWLSGETDSLEVTASETVQQIRQRVGADQQVSAQQVKFLCDGEVIADVRRCGELPPTVQVVLVDGWMAVSASYDHTLRVWDLLTHDCIGTLSGHSDRVCTVVADHRRRRAASGSWDWTARIWDLERMVCLGILLGHQDGVSAVHADFDAQIAVSCSWDHTLRTWCLVGMECTGSMSGHQDRVVSLSVDFKRKSAVSRSDDGVLKIWDFGRLECIGTLEGHHGWINITVVDFDCSCAICGAFDGTMSVWDLNGGEHLGMLTGHETGVNVICADFGRRRVVSGSSDGSLRLWDVEHMQHIRTFVSLGDVVNALAVDFVQNRAVSGSSDGHLEVWDLQQEARLGAMSAQSTSLINVIAADFRRQRAVTGSSDGVLRIWDMDAFSLITELPGHGRSVVAVCSQTSEARARM